MATSHNLYVMTKVTPIFPGGIKSEEFIVSEDFFYPLVYFDEESDSFNLRENNENYEIQTFEKKILPVVSNEYFLESDIESLCPCIQNLAFMKFLNRVKIRIDSLLFSVIMLEMKRSRTFRKNILSNFFTRYLHEKKVGTSNMMCIICNRKSIKVHAIIYLTAPKKNILDYKWNRKIQILVNEKCELENAMAWLSTLGGAFSALGDTFIECGCNDYSVMAEFSASPPNIRFQLNIKSIIQPRLNDTAVRAGTISMKQLYIALRLGDPLTICRCKIYLAMSLLQRGYYKKTKQMIRELYKFSTEGEGSRDFRLKNMCIAVWNRLKYSLSKKRLQKLDYVK